MIDIIDVEISELGKTITGKTPSSKNPEDFGEEFMFVTPSDNWETKKIGRTERYVSEIGINKLLKKALPPNSVMVSCIGSAMGKVLMNKSKCLTNQQINSIVVNEKKFNADYIYYVLINNYKLLRAAGTGSTSLPLLNKTDFDALKLKVHKDRKIQKQIAKVLSDLDAKIEVNNKINQELEAMAKTLYDYWFVQFDFPAYLSGSLSGAEGYKSSGGKMVFNKDLKREIPEGWNVNAISNWIGQDKSGDWGKEETEGNYTEKVSCIRGADLNGLNGKGEVKAPERYILEKNTHKILELGDIIVEISGGSPVQSTGRMGFITEETLERFENPLICSNFCKAVTLKADHLLYNFVYEWNRIYDAGVLFGWEGKTSGIKNFLFESFVTNYKVVNPPKELMVLFTKKAKPIHAQIQKNLQQNQKLSELRDWLLPMLMNGQVSVGSPVEERDIGEGYGEDLGELATDKYREVAEEGEKYL